MLCGTCKSRRGTRRSCVFDHWWFNIEHYCGTDWMHHDKQHSDRFVRGVIVNVLFALVCCSRQVGAFVSRVPICVHLLHNNLRE
jgi:hypothetical protein